MAEQEILMKMLDMLMTMVAQQATHQQQIIGIQEQYKTHQRDEEAHHAAVEAALGELAQKQETANEIFSQVKGGWKVFAAIGSFAALCGTAAAWAWQHLNAPISVLTKNLPPQ